MQWGDWISLAALGFAVWAFVRTLRVTKLDERIKELELRERTSADVQATTRSETGQTKGVHGTLVNHRMVWLVLTNHGPGTAYNVSASFEPLGRDPGLGSLQGSFPLAELPPGGVKEIPLTNRNLSQLWGFRMAWSWHNDDGTRAEDRRQDFS